VSRVELERRGDLGIVWLDPDGASVNTLSTALLQRFGEVIDEIERDDGVRAAVIASRAPRSFLAGADIREFLRFTGPDEVRAVIGQGHALLARLETARTPVVAAVHGACMGGGLELALACRGIVASDHPDTRFALPEVRLGLLPGLGGTQRLPRRVGLPDALDMALTGRSVYARRARRMGLVDAAVPREALLDAALRAAAGLAAGTWRRPPVRRRPAQRLQQTALARPLVWRGAERSVARAAGGHYPAPERILRAVRSGVEHGAAAGFEAEARAFAELLFTPEARALIHLFFAQSAARKNPFRELAEPRTVERMAVIGAGLMGSGIAQVSAERGMRVLLKDRELALAAKGKGSIYRGLSRRVGKGITPFERDRAVERVTLVDHDASLAGVQLTVEAVLEDVELKREVLRAVEAATVADPAAPPVYASNTSAIPIAQLAQAAAHPEAVVGMHYFSPVPRMPLLEVVVTDATADWATATAVQVGLAQGKTVITVSDGPGFYTTRVLSRYMAEALACLREGADVTLIDEAMRRYGFPMGPFELLDELGIDVGAKIQGVLQGAFAGRGVPQDDTLQRLVAAGFKGRKGGKGFYRRKGRGRAHEVDRGVYAAAGLGARRSLPEAEVRERLSLAMMDEAVRCLDEGVLRSPVDGDVGAVFGFAYPPFLGGPFFHADTVGTAALVERLAALAGRYGERFAPAEGLVRRARSGERFHTAPNTDANAPAGDPEADTG
jgi:3-hydroxyacyl-CoA dehydrogenase/enoyl-CoA hydratase/3-hydroxybutyryl-CoA epimerase